MKVGEKNGTNETQRMPQRDTGLQVNAISMSVNRWCEFPGTETGTIEEERSTVVWSVLHCTPMLCSGKEKGDPLAAWQRCCVWLTGLTWPWFTRCGAVNRYTKVCENCAWWSDFDLGKSLNADTPIDSWRRSWTGLHAMMVTRECGFSLAGLS